MELTGDSRKHPMAISTLRDFCQRFKGSRIVWTENKTVPFEIRQQALAAVHNESVAFVPMKRQKYKEVFVTAADWNGTRFILKKRQYPTVSVKIRAFAEKPLLREEYHAHLELDHAGILVPRGILYGERYRWGVLSESYLVTEWMTGRSVEQLYGESLAKDNGLQVHRFIKSLTEYLATLWRAGVQHADLNPGNILVVSSSEHQYSFCLLDLYPCRLVAKEDGDGKVEAYLRALSVLVVGLWLCAPTENRVLARLVASSLRSIGIEKADRRKWWPVAWSLAWDHYTTRVLEKRDRRMYDENDRFGRVMIRGIIGYYRKNDPGIDALERVTYHLEQLERDGVDQQQLLGALGGEIQTTAGNLYAVIDQSSTLDSPESVWTIANKLYNRSLPVLEPFVVIQQSGSGRRHRTLLLMGRPAGLLNGAVRLREWIAAMSDDQRQELISVLGNFLAQNLALFHLHNISLHGLTVDSIGLVWGQQRRLYILSPYAVCFSDTLDAAAKCKDLRLMQRICSELSLRIDMSSRHDFLRSYFQQNRFVRQRSRRHSNDT